MLNPLGWGDSIVLDGETGAAEWTVKRGDSGWYLKNADSGEIHSSIKDLDGMAEFIGAILEWDNAYYGKS